MIVPPAAILNLDPEPKAVIDLYIASFAPRTDLYVANGKAVVREPLTPEVVVHAVKHHYPISAYMAYCDDGVMRTHVSAIDFDSDLGKAQSGTIAKVLAQHRIEPVMFESRRGCHLWVMWGPDPDGKPPKAALVQRAMRQAISLAGFDPGDPTIEVFPKRGEDLAVGALRLPGMPHQRTQIMYPGWTMDGEKVDGMQSILLAFLPAPYDALIRLAGPAQRTSAYPKRQNPNDAFFFSRQRTRDDAPSASGTLRDLGIENARPGITVRCPAHQDRHRSLTIFKDDERVYCGAPSCPLHGDGHGVGSIALAAMAL